MRHQVGHRKLGRTTSHRLAMFRNMVTSLIMHERIKTTLPKAKELRSFAEKLVTLGKQGDLPARRKAAAFVRTNEAVQKLFSSLAPRFKDRKGGYTRVLKLGFRLGDSAPMAMIEYIPADNSEVDTEESPSKKKATAAKKAKTPKVSKSAKSEVTEKAPKATKAKKASTKKVTTKKEKE